MASNTFTTKGEQPLDAACFLHYGKTREVFELVLEANPQIVDAGSVLPTGTILAMPVVATSETLPPMTKLWD